MQFPIQQLQSKFTFFALFHVSPCCLAIRTHPKHPPDSFCPFTQALMCPSVRHLSAPVLAFLQHDAFRWRNHALHGKKPNPSYFKHFLCSTNYFSFFFVSYIIKLWNSSFLLPVCPFNFYINQWNRLFSIKFRHIQDGIDKAAKTLDVFPAADESFPSLGWENCLHSLSTAIRTGFKTLRSPYSQLGVEAIHINQGNSNLSHISTVVFQMPTSLRCKKKKKKWEPPSHFQIHEFGVSCSTRRWTEAATYYAHSSQQIYIL